jgi:hypothetical protein
MLGFAGIEILWTTLEFFPRNFNLLIPALSWFYLKSQFNTRWQPRGQDMWHAAPFALFLAYHLLVFSQGPDFVEWWKTNHSDDLKGTNSIDREFPYPEGGQKCDIVLRSNTYSDDTSWEWAIEIKRIQFIGDNGKNNDYGVGKLLSPYKKDTSLAGDIVKLQQSAVANKKAVIAYVFNYSFETCEEALKRHPNEKQVIQAL